MKHAEETELIISLKKCFFAGSIVTSSLVAHLSNYEFILRSHTLVIPFEEVNRSISGTVGLNSVWVITSFRSSMFGGLISTIEYVVLQVSRFQIFTLKSSEDKKCSLSALKDKELTW